MTTPAFSAPAALRSSPIRRLLAACQSPGVIQLGLGLPDPELYPTAALAQAAESVLRSGACLAYGASDGLPALRAWIAERMRTRGMRVAPEQVAITNGSQHALQVAMRLLAGPRRAVILEEPCYPGAWQAAEYAGLRAEAAPLSCAGAPDPERLAHLARVRGAIALWTMPTARNPTGATMTRATRATLSAACARNGLVVIEDDPYHELWYDRAPPPALAAEHPCAIHLGTFSKILAPGLRLGWMCLPTSYAAMARAALEASCLAPNHLAQRLVLAWLVGNDLDAHCAALRARYRARRDALIAAVREHCPLLDAGAPAPGGMFQWTRIRAGVSGAALAQAALARGVGVMPGGAFAVSGAPDGHLRLTFTCLRQARMRAGLRRLGAACADLAPAGRRRSLGGAA
jgi:2-aminoadipate transaminase